MGNRRDLEITISFGGNCTGAILRNRRTKKVIATGDAFCHPNDKFDPQIGAMIALARMFGDEVEFKPEGEELTLSGEGEKPLTRTEKIAKIDEYHLMRYGFPTEDGMYRVVVERSGGQCEYYTLHYNAKHRVFFSEPDIIVLTDEWSVEQYRNFWNNIIIAWKRVD